MAQRTASQTTITTSVLKQVAKNARIELTAQEEQKYIPQLNEILQFFDSIKEADTSQTQPSFLPVTTTPKNRDDNTQKCLTQEEALKNTTSKNGYIKGPRTT